MAFNEHDLWHQNAHLLFGFQCQSCDAMIGYGDVSTNPEEDFLKFCVEVTEEARKRGWVCVAEFKFYCPKCALANNWATAQQGSAMPLDDIAGEALGGVVRFIGQIISEVFIDILVRVPGYLICRACGYKGDPDGLLPSIVGVLFWAMVIAAGYWLFVAGPT